MLISKWRIRSHKYLGTVQVPIIDFEIQESRGQFIPFSFCLDSGAVVSLLPESAGRLLGLDGDAGEPIRLGSIGQRAVHARLHRLSIRLVGLPTVTAPFAVAELDNVPGLLGRLGFFGSVRGCFRSAAPRDPNHNALITQTCG